MRSQVQVALVEALANLGVTPENARKLPRQSIVSRVQKAALVVSKDVPMGDVVGFINEAISAPSLGRVRRATPRRLARAHS